MEESASAAETATSAAPSAATADIPPNQTLYVRNLNEKVKADPLKKSLYSLFSPFGSILEIVAMRTERARGQAWIVFADVPSATAAMRQLQGYSFYERPIVRPPRACCGRPPSPRAPHHARSADHPVCQGQE